MTAKDNHPLAAEFAEQLRQCQARLYGYLHSLLRDLNDADDLFQQTTIILWKKFAAFDRRQSFLAWACGIARFEVANFLRARGRQRLYFSDDLNLLMIQAQENMTAAEVDDRRDALAGCVDKLRQRDRELLVECYDDAAGVQEAASRRARSAHSVYNSLRRIRRSLFECINRTIAKAERGRWCHE